MLTEKDINIFTIVKDKNTISPLRQWCIDSWKKCMPNANIMIFDDSDLNNPNWKYYDVIKNDKLWNYYKNRKDIYSNCDSKIYVNGSKGHSAISTDSIRIRLLKAIPNALYMDSDAYLNITSKEFLELCNKYGDKDIFAGIFWYIDKHLAFSFTGYFSIIKNNIFLDKMIEYYDNTPLSKIQGDADTVRIVLRDNLNIFNIHDVLFLSKYDFVKHINCSNLSLGLNNFINHNINIMIVKRVKLGQFNRDIIKKQCEKYIHLKSNDLLSSHNKNDKPVFIFIINTYVVNLLLCDNFYKYENYDIGLTNIVMHDAVTNNEFIQKLKETINIYFKSLLDNGKSINYYELEDLGDDPCLLKKI